MKIEFKFEIDADTFVDGFVDEFELLIRMLIMKFRVTSAVE